jgi:hypothetical protein
MGVHDTLQLISNRCPPSILTKIALESVELSFGEVDPSSTIRSKPFLKGALSISTMQALLAGASISNAKERVVPTSFCFSSPKSSYKLSPRVAKVALGTSAGIQVVDLGTGVRGLSEATWFPVEAKQSQ